MIVFADNDILYKLAAWDLLPLLTESVGAETSQVRVLDTFVYSLSRSKSRKAKYGEEAIARLIAYVQGMPRLVEDDLPLCRTLPLYPDQIDAGERVLLAAIAQAPPEEIVYFTTGDKRAAINLPTAEGYEEVCEKVRGRIVCLEQILWLGARRHGIAPLRAGVALRPDCDKATGVIVASPQYEEGFLAYVRSLQRNCGGLLHRFPDLPEID